MKVYWVPGPSLAHLLPLFTQLLRWDWGLQKESQQVQEGWWGTHSLLPGLGTSFPEYKLKHVEFQILYFME